MVRMNARLALKLKHQSCRMKQHVNFVLSFPASCLYLLTRTPVCKCDEYCPVGVAGRAFRGVICPGTRIPQVSMKSVKPRLNNMVECWARANKPFTLWQHNILDFSCLTTVHCLWISTILLDGLWVTPG